MLTKKEADNLRRAVECVHIGGRWEGFGLTENDLLEAIKRATDTYETNDVIARGPNINSTNMLNDAARALGWRTDFACGDSPITWDKVLDAIRKHAMAKTVAVDVCLSCKGRLAIKKREGKRVEGVCLDCGCGTQVTNG